MTNREAERMSDFCISVRQALSRFDHGTQDFSATLDAIDLAVRAQRPAPAQPEQAQEAVACPACGQSDVGQYGEYPCRTCGLPKEWGNDPLSTQPETSATASEQPERIGDLLAVLLRTSERIGTSKDHAEVLKLRQQRREAYHQIAKACGVVIFDGPDAFAEADAAQRRLDDEIEAAGGLEAWRATASVAGLSAAAPAVEGHLLQDCDRGLSRWLASKPGALLHAREAAGAIALETAIAHLRNSIDWMRDGKKNGPCIGVDDMEAILAALTTHREHPAAQQERQAPVLAADHKSMRVDYTGLLRQVVTACERAGETAQAFMVQELQRNMQELGQRYYAGDVKVVDEFLQLYCVEKEARAALAAQAQKEKP